MPLLFGIIVSAFNALMGLVLKEVVIKFVLFAGLFALVAELTPILLKLLPTGDGGIASLLSNIPEGLWYFVDLVRLDVGLPAILSASVTRFIIRRLPIIG
jgi:hypothetical protein